MSRRKASVILVTGPPGIGKTTLVRKICEDLNTKHGIVCHGFITEEVRNKVTLKRLGFDVVGFDDQRVPLSRSGINSNGPFVGKYHVFVKEFEDFALPLLKPIPHQLLVIDEIGKMELLSKNFESAIYKCLGHTPVLAVVPLSGGRPVIDYLKHRPDAKMFSLSQQNRETVQPEIVNCILQAMDK